MTTELGLPEIEAAQNQKEVTSNEIDQDLEWMINRTLSKTVTGDFTVTTDEYALYFRHVLGGTPAAAFNMRLLALNRFLLIVNNTGQTATIGVDPAADGFDGTTITVDNNETAFIYTDGTDTTKIVSSSVTQLWERSNEAGTTYTFAVSDRFKVKTSSSSNPTTFTIPDFATVAIPVGSWIRIAQFGTGDLTIDTDAGVTLFGNGVSGNIAMLAGLGAGAVLWHHTQDEWYIEGNI